jgi:hypothetical protein
MSKSRAEEVAALSPENRRRYSTYRALGIISGVVSLFSFWILVPIADLMPSGHYGNLENIFQLAPLGFLIAIVGFVAAMILRSKAKLIRETYWHPSINNPVDEK